MEFTALLLLVFGSGAAFVLWLFASAGFLLWGARLTNIERRSYAKAIAAVLAGGLASSSLSPMCGAAPYLGVALSLVAAPCVSAVVLMKMSEAPFGKALAATAIAWIPGLLVAGGLGLLVLRWVFSGGFAP